MNQQQVAETAASDLFSIFAREKEDGSYYYSNEEAFDAMVFVILQTKMDLKKLPPSLDGVMHRFFDYLKLGPDTTPDQIAKAINSHFEKNPLNAELAIQLKRFSEGVTKLTSAAASEGLSKAAELIGHSDNKNIPTEKYKGPSPAMVRLTADPKKKN